MKITLYCRKAKKNPAKVEMFTRMEAEPCYDTPRIINLMAGIRGALDITIANCERDGVVCAGRRGDNSSVKLKVQSEV